MLIEYTDNGRIVGSITTPIKLEEHIELVGIQTCIESDREDIDLNLEYVKDGELTLRPNMKIGYPKFLKEHQDTVITGIPEGANLVYRGGEALIMDGSAEWGSTIAGKFKFRVECFPYNDVNFIIEVVE